MEEQQSNSPDQEQTRQSYEDFVYPSGVYYQTHPDRIAVAGALAGFSPAPVEKCRVLELGCSDGGNLNSMASGLPDSEFVGIDLSARQIEMARETMVAAELANVSFHAMSFTEIGEDLGEFDYIVAHGLFSWIPSALQSELLACCQRALSPNGLAYISFNTFPGSRQLIWLREKLLYHVRDLEGAHVRAKAGWEFAHFIAKMQEVQSGPYDDYMKRLLETFKKMPDPEAYFFHEYLEADNNPLLLSKFQSLARQNNLRYLGEAAPRNRTLAGVDPGLANVIRRFSEDPAAQEQYLDLALDTGFRRAILCREDAEVDEPLHDILPTSWLATCHASPSESTTDSNRCFSKANKQQFCTDHEPTIAVLEKLIASWPAACPLAELQELFSEPTDRYLRADSSEVLHRLYREEFVRFHLRPLPVATEPGERPLASTIVRCQVESRHQIPTLYHSNVSMDDPAASVILAALDGTRDRAELASVLLDAAKGGTIVVKIGDTPLQEMPAAEANSMARQIVEDKLQKALELGLLMRTD